MRTPLCSDASSHYDRQVTDELVRVGVAATEAEAVGLVSLLESAGVAAMYRMTNAGAGAFDGWSAGAPQEILVRAHDAELAREVLGPADAGRPAR
jgi:hypothetical protein